MRGLFSLAGRVALVTGGSRGLGRTIAQGFVEHGARVYVSGRSAGDCEAAAAALGAHGACLALPGDVTDPAVRAGWAAELGRREGRLDILVNNAGGGEVAPFEAVDEAGWDRTLALNLKAPFFLTQALAPLLRAAVRPSRPAKVINVASIDGMGVGAAESYAYQAAKAGLIQLTRRLAARLIGEGIVVAALAPGAFPSDLNVAARDAPDAFARVIPAGRVGEPQDLAGAAVFLAARAGDYVAGQCLAVDGGFVHARPTHGAPSALAAATPAATPAGPC